MKWATCFFPRMLCELKLPTNAMRTVQRNYCNGDRGKLRSTLVLFIFTWNFGPAQVHIYYTVEHVSIRYGITSTEFGKQQQPHRIHIYSIITVCGGNDSPLLRNAIIIARGGIQNVKWRPV